MLLIRTGATRAIFAAAALFCAADAANALCAAQNRTSPTHLLGDCAKGGARVAPRFGLPGLGPAAARPEVVVRAIAQPPSCPSGFSLYERGRLSGPRTFECRASVSIRLSAAEWARYAGPDGNMSAAESAALRAELGATRPEFRSARAAANGVSCPLGWANLGTREAINSSDARVVGQTLRVICRAV